MLTTVSSVLAKTVDSFGSDKAYRYINRVLKIVMALGYIWWISS